MLGKLISFLWGEFIKFSLDFSNLETIIKFRHYSASRELSVGDNLGGIAEINGLSGLKAVGLVDDVLNKVYDYEISLNYLTFTSPPNSGVTLFLNTIPEFYNIDGNLVAAQDANLRVKYYVYDNNFNIELKRILKVKII